MRDLKSENADLRATLERKAGDIEDLGKRLDAADARLESVRRIATCANSNNYMVTGNELLTLLDSPAPTHPNTELNKCLCRYDAMCCPVHDPTGARD